MPVNALERIALLRDLASDIIAEIELLATSNPNLIRLRAELINSDKLHITEAWDEEKLSDMHIIGYNKMMSYELVGTMHLITQKFLLIHIISMLQNRKIFNLQKKRIWKMC